MDVWAGGRVGVWVSGGWVGGGWMVGSPPRVVSHSTRRQDGDELWLTTGDMASTGSLLLPATALNGSELSHRFFRIGVEMRVHGGSGADGISFSYGRLPAAAVGEQGGGFGLRVSFHTSARCPPPQAC